MLLQSAEITLFFVYTMSGEIVTKEIGNGYYLHTYNVETYYLTETVISPLALPASQTDPNPFLMDKQSLGQFQPYRLSQCVQPRDAIIQKGQLIQLASVQNSKLEINPRAIEIFKKYEDNDISFVGNYGRLKSGKSFWYDKILNLSQFDGNSYSSNTKRQGIYFWSIPFTKGKLKFFLLDYVGFEGRDQLSKEDEKLLDLQLLLGEKFVIIPEPEDENLTILSVAYKHLLQSQQRFTDKGVVANKFSPYWPNQIYTLYRSAKPVRKEIDNIGTLFQVYNFSILHDAMVPGATGNKNDLSKSTVLAQSSAAPLNEKYVRMTSIVFQDIYDKMKGKNYGGTTFNGYNLPRIIDQAKIAINEGQGVKVDQIFKGVSKNISQDTLIRSKMLFLKEVEPLRSNGKPKPVDELIQAFDKGNRAAFDYFDSTELSRKDKDALQVKLRQELDTIQQEILQENQRKTTIHYSKILPPPQQNDTQQAYLQSLKASFIKQKQRNNLDHEDIRPVAQQLRSAVFLKPATPDNDESEEVLQMKRKIVESKRSLFELKEHKQRNPEDTKVIAIQRDYGNKEKQLVVRSKYLQEELEDTKKIADQSPCQKKAVLEQLREQHSKNEQEKAKLVQEIPQTEDIKALKELIKRQIAKNRQYEEGISSLQKSFMSNKSGRSVIREIKQENIKKVTIK